MTAENPAVLTKTPSNQSQLTQRKLNRLHKRLWRQQSKLMNRRIADPTTYDGAISSMASEIQRGVPLHNRKTLELALADAEKDKTRIQSQYFKGRGRVAKRNALSEFSRKGGKAPRRDALRDLIQKRVNAMPNTTQRRLFHYLRSQIGKGIIVSIDSESQLLDGDSRKLHYDDDEGRRREALVSGLKDRLARAKKKINSR